MSLGYESIISAFLMFIISLSMTMIPKLITRIDFIKKCYPYVTVLAAGFLLGVQLLDMNMEIILDHDHSGSHSHEHSHGHSHEHSHKHEHSHSHNHDQESASRTGLFVSGLAFIFLFALDVLLINPRNKKRHHHHHHDHHDHHHHHETEKTVEANISNAKNTDENVEGNNNISERMAGEENMDPIYIQVKKEAKAKKTEQLGCCNTDMVTKSTSKTQALIYICGISIHSFFEGLAIKPKLEMDTFYIGLLLHKILESFALGVPLFTSGYSFKDGFILASVYSSLTPLGMLLGTSAGKINLTVKRLFQGLALGSIMFMVSVEMIPPCFNHMDGNPYIKLLALTAGYVTSSLMVYLSHSH